MKIELNRETIPDDLYNMLLQNFVETAMREGYSVDKYTKFENWKIECKIEQIRH